MDQFVGLLRTKCKQQSTQVGKSLESALQTVEETVEETTVDEDMPDGQATLEKQQDDRQNPSKENAQ